MASMCSRTSRNCPVIPSTSSPSFCRLSLSRAGITFWELPLLFFLLASMTNFFRLNTRSICPRMWFSASTCEQMPILLKPLHEKQSSLPGFHGLSGTCHLSSFCTILTLCMHEQMPKSFSSDLRRDGFSPRSVHSYFMISSWLSLFSPSSLSWLST